MKDKHVSAPRSVTQITVRPAPGDGRQGLLRIGARTIRCALGSGGISARKREGDGATPLAAMAVLGGYVRNDRLRPGPVPLSLWPIRHDDGWCDAPDHASYNRLVRLPFAASHERLMRDDRLYDVVIVLDWNIIERRRNRGSAIFLHIAAPGLLPTQGCIAVPPAAMRLLLRHIRRGTLIQVER